MNGNIRDIESTFSSLNHRESKNHILSRSAASTLLWTSYEYRKQFRGEGEVLSCHMYFPKITFYSSDWIKELFRQQLTISASLNKHLTAPTISSNQAWRKEASVTDPLLDKFEVPRPIKFYIQYRSTNLQRKKKVKIPFNIWLAPWNEGLTTDLLRINTTFLRFHFSLSPNYSMKFWFLQNSISKRHAMEDDLYTYVLQCDPAFYSFRWMCQQPSSYLSFFVLQSLKCETRIINKWILFLPIYLLWKFWQKELENFTKYLRTSLKKIFPQKN